MLKKGAKTKTKRKPAVKFQIELGKFKVENDDEPAQTRRLGIAKVPATPKKRDPFALAAKTKNEEEEEEEEEEKTQF